MVRCDRTLQMIGNALRLIAKIKTILLMKIYKHFSDSLLATLLDAVRSCGNQDVHVRVSRTPRGKRVVPLSSSVDEETEANLLKLVMHNYQYPVRRFEIMERFNANIPHTGLNFSVTQDVSCEIIFYQIIQICMDACCTSRLREKKDLEHIN